MADDPTRIRPPRETGRRGGGRCLVFVEGEPLLGVRVPLDGEVELGRAPGCEVVLASEEVSRRHARIVPDGDGHRVHDLGSTNGTFVNGEEVEARALAPGDRIQLGPFVARYLSADDREAQELESLAGLARTDRLTGLPNRRALDEALGREVARARRAGTALAALAIDVDHFKRVNDRHGHAAGDAVLAAVAARAAGALRAGDLLARQGGEELLALLPGAGLGTAREVAERLRAAVADGAVETGAGPVAVTVSVGCAVLDEATPDAAALLARADARLYDAKRNGRDRVEG